MTFPSPLWGGWLRSRRVGPCDVSVTRARQLRKALTPQEAKLWSRLKRLRSEGLHIRRQAPFRGYYLDFVCFERRLVIEIDGSQHADSKHDRVRDRVLDREGFETLRIWNADVTNNLEGVLATILHALAQRPPTRALRAHPPHEGEG